MHVVVVGDNPVVEDLFQIIFGAGHQVDVFLAKEFLSTASNSNLTPLPEQADIVIEAHDVSAESKRRLLQRIDEALSGAPLLLTSALSISVTQAAAWTQNPERVIGYSLLTPVGPDLVVEIAGALQSDDAAVFRAEEFWREAGFDPVRVADGPGLVRARILCCLMNEAIGALMEGVSSTEDIDKAMRLGTNYPMGPLAWADHLGLDAVYAVMTALHEEWGEDRYRPSPLLRRKVLAGQLGKKSGRGFYEY